MCWTEIACIKIPCIDSALHEPPRSKIGFFLRYLFDSSKIIGQSSRNENLIYDLVGKLTENTVIRLVERFDVDHVGPTTLKRL